MCKFAIVKGGAASIKCGRYDNWNCPYQYWCTNDKCYKSTATKSKCKYYEEAEDSKQLNQK